MPEVKELRSLEELEVLAPEWDILWARTGKSPFQSAMWLLPWARQFTRENLVVVSIRREGKLVAVCPFYVWNNRLFLLGNGISDYLDICAAAGDIELLRGELSGWLESQRFADELEFNQLPADSILLQIAPAGFQGVHRPGDSCPVLSLENKEPDYFAPPRQLEKLRYYERRAAKIGDVKFEKATSENCGSFLDQLFKLHSARWSEKGGGVLAETDLQQFHSRAVNAFARGGFLRMYRFRIGSEIAGVLYAFANERATFFYLSGFDPKFEKLSPGALMIGHAIREAMAEGNRAFDFLRGSEPYKYHWGACDQQTTNLLLSR